MIIQSADHFDIFKAGLDSSERERDCPGSKAVWLSKPPSSLRAVLLTCPHPPHLLFAFGQHTFLPEFSSLASGLEEHSHDLAGAGWRLVSKPSLRIHSGSSCHYLSGGTEVSHEISLACCFGKFTLNDRRKMCLAPRLCRVLFTAQTLC